MEAVRLDDAAEFLAQAEPLLLADEARHNLILGIAGTIRDSPDVYPLRSLWLVRDGGAVVAAALRTPPYNLILARPTSPAALEALVGGIAEALPGVNGSVPEVQEFAASWAERTGASARTNMRQGVYALEQVEALAPAPGSARLATADDRELALRWWIAFGDEVLHERRVGRPRGGGRGLGRGPPGRAEHGARERERAAGRETTSRQGSHRRSSVARIFAPPANPPPGVK